MGVRTPFWGQRGHRSKHKNAFDEIACRQLLIRKSLAETFQSKPVSNHSVSFEHAISHRQGGWFYKSWIVSRAQNAAIRSQDCVRFQRLQLMLAKPASTRLPPKRVRLIPRGIKGWCPVASITISVPPG